MMRNEVQYRVGICQQLHDNAKKDESMDVVIVIVILINRRVLASFHQAQSYASGDIH